MEAKKVKVLCSPIGNFFLTHIITQLHYPVLQLVLDLLGIKSYKKLYNIFTCGFIARFCFYARKQLCFQRILAIAILSVRLSVTWVDQAKTVQARITKSSPSAARKTLVSKTVKLFQKFKRGSPQTRALNERGVVKICDFRPVTGCISITVRGKA